MSTPERIAELIDSVGLNPPAVGEYVTQSWAKIADALEKLIAVARAALAVELVDESGLEQLEAYEALQNALQALEIDP